MNGLEEKEERLAKEVIAVRHARKVFSSIEAVAIRNQLYIDFLDAIDHLSLSRYTLDSRHKFGYSITYSDRTNKCTFNLITAYMTEKRTYAEIGDLVNSMGYGTDLAWHYIKSKEIDGVIFNLTKVFRTEMPEDDIKLLVQIGKIKEELIPSRVDTVMLCDSSQSIL